MSKINVNELYFHSIIHGCDESLKVVNGILSEGAIKSPKSLGVKARPGCHKENDICLSKMTKPKNIRGISSCFDLYLPRLTSFAIDRSISFNQRVLKAKCVPVHNLYNYDEGTVTNLYDEYRTKEDISLDYIKGICIPYNNLVEDPFSFTQFISEEILMGYYNGLLDYYTIEQIRKNQTSSKAKEARIELLELYIGKIEEMLKHYDSNIPIYTYDKKYLYRR